MSPFDVDLVTKSMQLRKSFKVMNKIVFIVPVRDYTRSKGVFVLNLSLNNSSSYLSVLMVAAVRIAAVYQGNARSVGG